MLGFFKSKYIFKGSSYTETIKTWKQFLPDKQIYIGFFDNIESSPDKLLLELFAFLEVNVNRKYIEGVSRKTINESPLVDMPEKYKDILADLFKEELEKLKCIHKLSWDTQIGNG